LVFCTTKNACENGAKMFMQQAADPSEELVIKRWSVTLDLLAAQASQIHEPLGSILKYGLKHSRDAHLKSALLHCNANCVFTCPLLMQQEPVFQTRLRYIY
jgi:hypothetical protein